MSMVERQISSFLDFGPEVDSGQVDEIVALDRAKSRVLIELLNELRTPLMMLKSPLQNGGAADSDAQGRVLEQAAAIQNGLDRAVSILEMELGVSSVPAETHDFSGLVERFAAARRSMAERNGIRFTFSSDGRPLPVSIHRTRIEQLLEAIADRAVCALSDGDVLRFRLETDTHVDGRPHAALTIDHRDGRDVRENLNGTTALALAIGRRALRQHGGRFTVDRGESHTSYRIDLPLAPGHAADDDAAPDAPTAAAAADDDRRKDRTTILVVDDHAGTRAYLRYVLRKHHRILEAADGKEALEIVRKEEPDLVLSDIMMPVMDGNQLCRAIKADEELNHIPVFLVTANAVRTMKTESLESGADDYLVKPFDVSEAVMRINNEIEMRGRLRRRYSRELVIKPSDITVTSEDEAFINRARELVEENIEDSDFSVQDMASEMGFSSRQLQRRLRETVDQSPVEFIRTLRLKRAGQLLEARYGNVSEVAYSVGFTSLSYFAKCFKEQFGESPSNFKESHSG